MKKLLVLLALLLTLTPAASALTVTAADLGNPSFSWGSYTLTLSLYTDDQSRLGATTTPADGATVMVRLTSSSGQIALYDIVAGAKRFELKDVSGAVYQITQWHVSGATVKNGAKALNDQQDAFDLIYRLPDSVSHEGMSLFLRGEDGSEHLLAELSGSGSENAGTTQHSPDQQAADFLSGILSKEAENAEDTWVQAILKAGAKDVRLQDDKLTFSLRSFNPGLKALKETDAGDFMRHLYQNASAYDLACTLNMTDEGGLAATAKSQKALIKAVKNAASQSQKAFNSKKVRIALAGYLLSSRASDDLRPGSPKEELEPLFVAQLKQELSVNDGPHALRLRTTGVADDTLLSAGYESAYQRLSRQQGANAQPQDEIKRIYLEELTAKASALKKKGAEKIEFVLDIDLLFAADKPYAGDAYSSFIFRYDGAYNLQLLALYQDVAAMPDYPALDYPKSGRIKGSSRGTKVIFKVPKDGFASLIQIREVDTDNLVVTAFAKPGQSATVRVPKGEYYILVASGMVWYGEEFMFGDDGFYMRTEDIQIKGSNYYHVLTLGGVKDGNMSAYDAEPYEFLQPGGNRPFASM